MKTTITAIRETLSDNAYHKIYVELYSLYQAYKILDSYVTELDNTLEPTNDYAFAHTTSIAYLKNTIYDTLLEKVQALVNPLDFVERLEQQLKDENIID